jgi:PhnB protein
MATINTYLNFDGKTEEAFNFYKSVFGGEFTTFQRIKEIPGANQFPVNEQDRVMHVSLPIGKTAVLMGSDTLPSMGHKINIGNNTHITINPDSEAEAEKLFKGLSSGGNVTQPLEKAFWGAYFGMFVDKYGVQWMVNYDLNQKQG